MRSLALALALVAATPAIAATPKPFDVDILANLDRISGHKLSPDGKTLVYQLRTTDHANNRGRTSLWTVPAAGGTPQRLTAADINASSPNWSADGSAVYFVAAKDGTSQLWRQSLRGKAEAVTSLPLDVDNYALSPDGKQLLVSMQVFTDCADLDCTKQRLDARAKDKSSGVVYDQLFIRHWDTWADGRRNQLFVAAQSANGNFDGARRLSVGIEGDVPSKPFGDDSEFAWSADGKTVYFNARVAGTAEAWSTNFDIYSVPADASAAPKNLTAANPAWDGSPLPSREGKTLYYLAMSRPGFEADRFAIKALDLASGKLRDVAPDWDRSASALAESVDGATLYTASDDWGQHPLFGVDVASGKVSRLLKDGAVSGLAVGSSELFVGIASLQKPNDLYAMKADGSQLRQLTTANAARLADVGVGAAEFFTFKGWNNEDVQGYVVQPVGFEKGRKYPVAFIIHGGPQGAMTNSWSYRWNPQTYAGQGYAVVTINFHGSTGYGQAFTDSIAQDWGGKPLEDLKLGWAAALKKYPVAFIIHGGPQGSMGNSFHYRWNPQSYAGAGYAAVFIDFHGSTGYGQAFTDAISGDWGGKPLEDLQKGWVAAQKKYDFLDGDRACALGASYGGYMINWIAGNWNDAWKCLVNHDGVFDTRSMGYVTEELWFTEWENGGTPYDQPANYERWNPVNHVSKWRTPMLVIQGEKDYRVPVDQGLSTFTALQRRGIESQLLYFPDENHWVLKPQNSIHWHETVIDWLDRHTGK